MAMKKKFDAVAESRKWRVATGKKLSSMDPEVRQNYLNEEVEQKLNALRSKSPAPKSKRKRRRTATA
jgi:hypothetical protein